MNSHAGRPGPGRMRELAARVRTVLRVPVAFVGMLSFAVERTASILLVVLPAGPAETVPRMTRTALSRAAAHGARMLGLGR